MKFLFALFFLFFAVVLFSCQSGVSVPDKEDYNKLQGLVTQIEAQMQVLRTELEQITDYNEFLLQKRDSILASSSDFKYTMEGAFSTNLPGQDASLSTVVILDSSSDPKKAKQLIQLTNSMDSVFATFMQNSKFAGTNANCIKTHCKNQFGRVFDVFSALQQCKSPSGNAFISTNDVKHSGNCDA